MYSVPHHERPNQMAPSLPPPHTYGMEPVLPPVPPPPPREPSPLSTRHGDRIYSLQVVQQPVRARMCGFGDKDRRPITPPPCVKLTVVDANTLKELEVSEIDISFFVLTVDLWNASGEREVNLVRHSATSPSISTATSSSYPPPAQPQPMPYPTHQYGSHPHPMYTHGYQQPYYTQPAYNPQTGMTYPPQQYYPTAGGYVLGPASQGMPPQPGVPAQIPPGPVGMFTRNLIGSLSASAFRLTDPDNRLGIWFILQDLSVRTEGSFRLKMNFVDVGKPCLPSAGEQNGSPATSTLNRDSAPVLASVFSDVFHVFSAKKFPGVIESTALSKCFAMQGIKIPIRKDGVKGPRGTATAVSMKNDADDEWDD